MKQVEFPTPSQLNAHDAQTPRYKLAAHSVEAITGNLIEQSDFECIVNAANGHLQMGGGVAGAIRCADPSTQIATQTCPKSRF